MIDFEQDNAAPAEGASLERIVALAKILRQRQSAVEDLTQELSDAKEQLRKVEQEDLPELMRELGLELMRLEDGSTVEVVPDVQCAITEAHRPAAHAWLTANGFGGLIKTEVSVAFGRGEHDAALALAEKIGGQVKESVHAQTLKAFVKEQMEAGTKVPFDLFSVFPFNKAKLKPAKKAR